MLDEYSLHKPESLFLMAQLNFFYDLEIKRVSNILSRMVEQNGCPTTLRAKCIRLMFKLSIV